MRKTHAPISTAEQGFYRASRIGMQSMQHNAAQSFVQRYRSVVANASMNGATIATLDYEHVF
jgi:hypothetical protein